jgi:hypothetical protein
MATADQLLAGSAGAVGEGTRKEFEAVNTPTHAQIAEEIQQVVEVIALGDWRAMTSNQLNQVAAHLRAIKARCIATCLIHPKTGQDVLSFLDQALVALYTVLDRLEGHDQHTIYQALLEVQHPLLLAHATIPREGESTQAPAPVEVPQQAEEDSSDIASQGEGKQFRWTQERVRLLRQALEGSRQPTMAATIAAIAQQYGWPARAVEYKVYALQRTQQASHEKSPALEPEKEGD